jgi:hypothetical protein
VEPAETALELFRHGLVVLVRDVFDMALEPRLRPPALIVAARSILRPVGDLGEPASLKSEQASGLAVDDDHERAFATADERDERCEQEVVGDADRVRHPHRQRERAPDVVEPRGEDGEAVRAVPVEVGVEVSLEPLEVRLQTLANLVRKVTPRGAV